MRIERPQSVSPMPDHARRSYHGKMFDVYEWEQEMFDGSKAIFEKITRADSVNVIAVTTEGRIIILHEQQPGTRPFIGLPGGRIDPGEDPLAAIQRELLEETGYSADDWQLFHAVQPASKIDWACYTFIARGCRQSGETKGEPGEKIELTTVTYDECISALIRPEFRDSEVALEVLRRLAAPDTAAEFRQLLGVS